MEAFAEAIYRVNDDGHWIPMRIGVAVPALAALLARQGVTEGGLVTGENPFGQEQSPAENRHANAALAVAIDALGLSRLDSDGGSEDRSWNEPGFLVLGATPAQMDQLSRQFRQAAWVHIDARGLPSLAGCRYPLHESGASPCWPPGVVPDP